MNVSYLWGWDGEVWWLVECRNGEPHRAFYPERKPQRAFRDTFSRWALAVDA